MKKWLTAFRLRTLPLALSSIGMGSFIAAAEGVFNVAIFTLCALTTIFLQILSNLANDYGDSVNGADHNERQGPSRMVQSGAITLNQMKAAMFVFVLLSLISGILLLYVSFGLNWQAFLFFFAVGIGAILAAIAYTAGRKPYGYIGLGDLSVFIFFGIVGVVGSYYLYANTFKWDLLLPAISCGLFSVAVLNVNNIRDIESDKKAGKYSVPVRIGRSAAINYHVAIIFIGVASACTYILLNYTSITQFSFVIMVPLFIANIKAVKTKMNPNELDPYLKQMALSTLLFVVLFGIGQLI
ncbi:1,4-dihydroxy-2-naphthoate polyprenyltransferase [Fulvivirga lutea]|uniref:1,4-dihydroxy-2-naphthoate octaprenyltransferase n=1 Tax=Fulvivirga lutea TaxID=2810512 RepID=A0A974WEE8_9BACT|nr:1,4-dihydroxy-2-naphthoate polyprenyltransferase [Fulvivirga lutea]QSE95843.1 1,4-dihydroxy-2-naphthoate polyprenyltransferase [Fulvivirga lutea]